MILDGLTKTPGDQRKTGRVDQREAENVEEEPFNIEETWTEEEFKKRESA